MTDLAEQRGRTATVYQPAEDSRLLATAAVERFDASDLVLEVGCGSGVVAERVSDGGTTVIGSDINPHACRATRDRGIPVVQSNLVEAFESSTFDGVLFNPPYLPMDEPQDAGDWELRALSGGSDGRAVIDPFLEDVGRVLVPDGRVLLLLSSLTGVEAVIQTAEASRFSAIAVAEETYPFETLTVVVLTR